MGSDGQSEAVSRPSLSGPANQAQGGLLKVQRRVSEAERCQEAVSGICLAEGHPECGRIGEEDAHVPRDSQSAESFPI